MDQTFRSDIGAASLTFGARSALNPERSSNSRTRSRPPSQATREPWKWIHGPKPAIPF